MTAVAACRTCGTEPLENARFCHGCGSPVDDGDTRAEYKQVTVLFADVVHSMDIAAAVGPERLREIMADLVDRCCGGGAALRRHGGQVHRRRHHGGVRRAGGVGGPRDARLSGGTGHSGGGQAARPLEVQERDGMDLRMRVGLNSGQVIAGEIGSGALGYTAIGEQVGMAQRMESVAPPGGVMLSDVHGAAGRGRCGAGRAASWCASRAPTDAVPARRLLGMAAARAADRSLESTLVGRAVGIGRRRRRCWIASIDGRGSVVGVVGPPGIGKTRLVARSRRSWRKAVVWRCSPPSANRTPPTSPFQVVARLLRAVGRRRVGWTMQSRAGTGAGTGSRRRSRGPAAARRPAGHRRSRGGAAEDRPGRAAAAVDRADQRRPAGAHRPAVFVIEDAHWIDEVSESMLADFLAVIPQTPLAGADHLPPRISGRVEPDVAGAQTHRPGTAE